MQLLTITSFCCGTVWDTVGQRVPQNKARYYVLNRLFFSAVGHVGHFLIFLYTREGVYTIYNILHYSMYTLLYIGVYVGILSHSPTHPILRAL